jgi:hypothetical protein
MLLRRVTGVSFDALASRFGAASSACRNAIAQNGGDSAWAAASRDIRPINDQTNQTDIPAISGNISVHKNGPQRWVGPDWLDGRTDNNNGSRERPLSHSQPF